jgi:hypothetical protein
MCSPVDLGRWPDGTRAIARREEPHPGAQLTFTDADGHRFQVFITDQTDDDILAGRLGLLLADTGHHCTVPGRSMASSGSGNSLLPVGVVYAFDSRLPLP